MSQRHGTIIGATRCKKTNLKGAYQGCLAGQTKSWDTLFDYAAVIRRMNTNWGIRCRDTFNMPIGWERSVLVSEAASRLGLNNMVMKQSAGFEQCALHDFTLSVFEGNGYDSTRSKEAKLLTWRNHKYSTCRKIQILQVSSIWLVYMGIKDCFFQCILIKLSNFLFNKYKLTSYLFCCHPLHYFWR